MNEIKHSDEWRIVSKAIDEAIEEFRTALESGGGDRERGGIAALRNLKQKIEDEGPAAAPSTYFPAGRKPT